MTHKKTFVQDFTAGQSVSDTFALAQAQRKEAKNGPYWQLTLTDRSGSIEARMWFPQSQRHDTLKAEQFVAVTGQVVSFKDQLQMNITELSVLDPDGAGLDLADFLPCSAVPPETILADIERLLAGELSFKPWKALCRNILHDDDIRAALLTAPGAKAIHHAHAGGLLEHTLGVMRVCQSLADLYPCVDKEILLVGALLHDLGKAFELTHGISREYTDQGRLLGHIELGLEILTPFLRKAKDLPEGLALHLKHLLISHHGELEFGSPRRPKTVEAFILHYADNLDAKINTVQGALANPDTGDAGTWSEYQRSLSRYVFQPARTPVPAGEPAPKSAKPGKTPTRSTDAPLLKLMGLESSAHNS
ncbi:MAG: HD domain-containing protein [Deltaproteobacteria bacterium]|nr:HD domain-containing protein [Deltaproteobacteria bacterium]